MDLQQAPKHVRLAVDLIMLLENHQIDAQTALLALDIVQRDYLQKQHNQQQTVAGEDPP